MPNPVPDEFLERRAKGLHNRLATIRLSTRGLEVTAERLKQSLSWSTVSVVETTVNGKAIRIVTTNDSSFYKLLQENPKTLLLPGEILGSRPTYVYGPIEPKKRPPRQSIHAEQLGANDAVKMGATSGRIATSNPGCGKQCVALLTEEFPSFKHVNPSSTASGPTIISGAVISNVTESPGQPGVSPHLSTRGTTSGQPVITERMISTRHLESGPTRGAEQASKAAYQVEGEPVTKVGAHVMPHPAGAQQAVGGAGYGLRAAAIGRKAWKVTRTIGKILVSVFVPLKVLDIVFEVSLALWDREREKEERKRREKQKALEAVFKLENNITAGQFRFDKKLKEETKVQSLIQSKILNNAALFDEFVQDWDNDRKFMGFLYARVNAELHIEVYRDLMTNKDAEAFTTYNVTSLDVQSTSWAHDFDWTEIGEEKEVKKTESDTKRLVENGVLYPEFFKKIVKRKRLKYTLVPPLFTPFDIVVTKINNLFLDMVIVIDSFHRTGGIANFTGFNYKCSWNEQFPWR